MLSEHQNLALLFWIFGPIYTQIFHEIATNWAGPARPSSVPTCWSVWFRLSWDVSLQMVPTLSLFFLLKLQLFKPDSHKLHKRKLERFDLWKKKDLCLGSKSLSIGKLSLSLGESVDCVQKICREQRRAKGTTVSPQKQAMNDWSKADRWLDGWNEMLQLPAEIPDLRCGCYH